MGFAGLVEITNPFVRFGEFLHLIKRDPKTYLKEYSEKKFCDLVEEQGYDCEEYPYAVKTSDFPNYFLTLHRIRSKDVA